MKRDVKVLEEEWRVKEEKKKAAAERKKKMGKKGKGIKPKKRRRAPKKGAIPENAAAEEEGKGADSVNEAEESGSEEETMDTHPDVTPDSAGPSARINRSPAPAPPHPSPTSPPSEASRTTSSSAGVFPISEGGAAEVDPVLVARIERGDFRREDFEIIEDYPEMAIKVYRIPVSDSHSLNVERRIRRMRIMGVSGERQRDGSDRVV